MTRTVYMSVFWDPDTDVRWIFERRRHFISLKYWRVYFIITLSLPTSSDKDISGEVIETKFYVNWKLTAVFKSSVWSSGIYTRRNTLVCFKTEIGV